MDQLAVSDTITRRQRGRPAGRDHSNWPAFPHPHPSLGQIHSALGYYFDHQEELDRQICQREQVADEFFANPAEPAIVARLRAVRSGP